MAEVDESQAPETAQEEKLEADTFSSLLQRDFRVESEDTEKQSQIESAVKTLAQQAIDQADLVSNDAISTIEKLLVEIDKRLTQQVNLILHHEDFQQVEGAWRGLHYLINNTETDEMLKIKLMDISKQEVGNTLQKFSGAAWDQSPLFKKIYGEYDVLGGEPYGCLVADYQFDNKSPDVSLLSEMAQISAASHAPFIAGAAPSVLNMNSWQELNEPRDLTKIFGTPDYASWRSLRDAEDSRYIGLAMPRFLARLPYGPETDPVAEFHFEEDTASGDHSKYTWANSAYAMAVNINRAFKLYGWCTRIRGVESGGLVEALPVHSFPTDDGSIDMKCPTEIAIGDRREAELAKNGFMPVLHRKNTDMAAFIGAQSLQKPVEYDDDDATANAQLSARLPYLFAACRFAHYLKCIVRDKVGSFAERSDMEAWLNKWINRYVEPNPAIAGEVAKAKKPLAAAEVVVDDIPGNPGYYSAKIFLRPHYQLEGLTASLRLVSKLPSQKQ